MYNWKQMTERQKMQAGAIAAAIAIVLVLIIVVVMHKKPAAAAAKCTDDSDCSTGMVCNTATGACFAGCSSSAECAQANPALPYCVGNQCAAACVVGSTTALCANDASQCIDQKCSPCTNVKDGTTSTGCSSSTAPFCYTTGGFPAGPGTCVECGWNPSTTTSLGCSSGQACAPANNLWGPGTCVQCFLDQPGSATNSGIGCKNNPTNYTPGASALGACLASTGLTGTGPGQCHDCIVWSEGVSVGCSGNNVCTSSSGTTGPGTCSAPASVHASKKMQLNSQFGNQ